MGSGLSEGPDCPSSVPPAACMLPHLEVQMLPPWGMDWNAAPGSVHSRFCCTPLDWGNSASRAPRTLVTFLYF